MMQFWDIRKGCSMGEFTAHKRSVKQVKFLSDFQGLASVGDLNFKEWRNPFEQEEKRVSKTESQLIQKNLSQKEKVSES